MHCSTSCLIAFLMMVLLVPGVMAFTVSPVSVDPGIMNPGDPVNVSCTVYAAYGTAFSSYNDLQFVTGLDDPVWAYTILVNDIQNTRPNDRGKTLTISGYELSYREQDEVIVKMALHGHVPMTAATGANISVLKIQEMDARNNVIANSVIDAGHLVGLPTPTPTPAYGSIAITSEPPGANVYLDNIIRGISPVTIEAVPNGHHTILLRLDGYEDYTSEVRVTADAPQVNARLVSRSTPTVPPATPTTGTTTPPGGVPVTIRPTLQAGTGSLSVTTIPAGALVFIDGQMKGVTPATIPGLSPGTHSIELILDGYQDFTTTTEITAGTTSEFITGLPKRKQTPGFTGIVALAAVGLLLAAKKMRNGKQ
ncbi:MAG: PEGA domain-containing protein [Methanoregula sp.]|nr:PEGA domain-containing protein [Methanoregula sp.]